MNAVSLKTLANLLSKNDPGLLRKTITDEDFCLFMDFPFHQMIVFALDGYFSYFKEVSWTKIWVAKYADQLLDLDEATFNSLNVYGFFTLNKIYPFMRTISALHLKNESIVHCDFEKKINLLQQNQFSFEIILVYC